MIDPLSLLIEKKTKENNSYIESIVDYAAENFLDVEDVLEIVNQNIVDKVRQEFIDKHYLPEMKNESNILSFMKE
ncbi:hypothetical protein GW796_09350 [archaeon]|nr:hypothetical protein [archaeon]NCT58934.1 hypothetical protein [archaeon]